MYSVFPMTNTFTKKFLLIFFFVSMSMVQEGFAQNFSVPNSGSPYVDLKDLDNDQILHLATGITVTTEQLIESLSGARVIYIGETHDNLEAHRVQLEIIRRLNNQFPGRIAVGMEMFRRSAQIELDEWLRGNRSAQEFKKLFGKNWGRGYKWYQPIFDYLKENRVPLFGLKSSRETEARLRTEGLNSASTSELFPEIDESDVYHKAYSESIFGGHSEFGDVLYTPYQMLLLWEESMAQTVAEFLENETYRDWKMVVLAGGFHVQYGFGIPKRAFRRVPHDYAIILPTVTQIPPELKDRQMDTQPVAIPLLVADFAWKLEYKVSPKNKIKMGVFLEELDRGLRVNSVANNSNAYRAGILKEDVLLELDGINIANLEDFIDRLQEKKFGDRVLVKIMRKDSEIEFEVLLSP